MVQVGPRGGGWGGGGGRRSGEGAGVLGRDGSQPPRTFALPGGPCTSAPPIQGQCHPPPTQSPLHSLQAAPVLGVVCAVSCPGRPAWLGRVAPRHGLPTPRTAPVTRATCAGRQWAGGCWGDQAGTCGSWLSPAVVMCQRCETNRVPTGVSVVREEEPRQAALFCCRVQKALGQGSLSSTTHRATRNERRARRAAPRLPAAQSSLRSSSGPQAQSQALRFQARPPPALSPRGLPCRLWDPPPTAGHRKASEARRLPWDRAR